MLVPPNWDRQLQHQEMIPMVEIPILPMSLTKWCLMISIQRPKMAHHQISKEARSSIYPIRNTRTLRLLVAWLWTSRRPTRSPTRTNYVNLTHMLICKKHYMIHRKDGILFCFQGIKLPNLLWVESDRMAESVQLSIRLILQHLLDLLPRVIERISTKSTEILMSRIDRRHLIIWWSTKIWDRISLMKGSKERSQVT